MYDLKYCDMAPLNFCAKSMYNCMSMRLCGNFLSTYWASYHTAVVIQIWGEDKTTSGDAN